MGYVVALHGQFEYKDEDGVVHQVDALQGPPGKSAWQYAKESGLIDESVTQEEYMTACGKVLQDVERIRQANVTVNTLGTALARVQDAIAQAQALKDEYDQLREQIAGYNTSIENAVNTLTQSIQQASSAATAATNAAGEATSAAATAIASSTSVLPASRLPTSGIEEGGYGPEADAVATHAGTFLVPYIEFDATGRATYASTQHITLPSAIAQSIPFASCMTEANVAAKVATTTSTINLANGTLIFIKFFYNNTTVSPTLNVNGLGAKPIRISDSVYYTRWMAGQTILLRYDTEDWKVINVDIEPFTDIRVILPASAWTTGGESGTYYQVVTSDRNNAQINNNFNANTKFFVDVDLLDASGTSPLSRAQIEEMLEAYSCLGRAESIGDSQSGGRLRFWCYGDRPSSNIAARIRWR